MCTAGKMGSRCEIVTRIETPCMGLSDGNPRMGLSRVILLPNRDQGDLSNRSPICRGIHVYVSTHVHTWVHLHACVWVGLGKLYK